MSQTKKHASAIAWSLIGILVTSLAFAGWHVRDYIDAKLATKEEVILAGAKADYVIDRQMEAIIAQIAYLERKGRLTPGEVNQLNYLRQQLMELRRVRAAK